MAHSSSKKRQAINTLKNTHNQTKKSKLEDHSTGSTKKGGLFDESDEEMDPNVLDSVLQQLNDDDDDDKYASTSANDSDSDSDSDGMDLNDNNTRDTDDGDDYSITSTGIPEVDPISDLLQTQDQDHSLSEHNNDDMVIETESQQSDQPSPTKPEATKHDLSGKFRDHYMGRVTLAFGSDLDMIRQEPGFTGARLNVLIDSLESGITIFSDLEKSIILANENNS